MTDKAMLPYLKWLVAYFKEEYDVFRNKQPHGLSCCIVYSFIKRRWKRRAVWKCYKSEIAAEYQVKGIPCTFILDEENRIVAKNLRGRELEKKIEEMLKKKKDKE